MKNLTAIIVFILLSVPACSSFALFGEKQAREEAELQAVQAQAELKNVKREAAEATRKAEEEHRNTKSTFVVVTLLLAGSLVYTLTHRKTFHQTVQQVVNVQAPPHQIVTNSVVIDGTNVICHTGGDRTSLLRLLGLVTDLQKSKYTYKCYFDASTFHVLVKCGLDHHGRAYRYLLNKYPTSFVEVPGGTQADDAILDYAHHHGTPIISNDQFREYKETYRWLENASKWRVPFVVHPTMVQLNRLGMQVKVPVVLNTALKEFSDLLTQVSGVTDGKRVQETSASLQHA